jgi:hypothetical protein
MSRARIKINKNLVFGRESAVNKVPFGSPYPG